MKRELCEELTGLRDEAPANRRSVRCTPPTAVQGPYLREAPDLIVGYNEGYRTSWDAAVGKVNEKVCEDNCKAWSGDHCVDPLLVPGVLFSNRRFEAGDPGLEDLAPTALTLFGVACLSGWTVRRYASRAPRIEALRRPHCRSLRLRHDRS